MNDLEKLVRSDWDALHLLGRIALKLGVKKNQTITHRIDEMIDVINATHHVETPPKELTEARDKFYKQIS